MKQFINEAKRWQKLAGINENLNEDPVGQQAAGNPDEEESLRNSQIDMSGEDDTLFTTSERERFVDEQKQQIKSGIGLLMQELEMGAEEIREVIEEILQEIENPEMPSNEQTP